MANRHQVGIRHAMSHGWPGLIGHRNTTYVYAAPFSFSFVTRCFCGVPRSSLSNRCNISCIDGSVVVALAFCSCVCTPASKYQRITSARDTFSSSAIWSILLSRLGGIRTLVVPLDSPILQLNVVKSLIFLNEYIAFFCIDKIMGYDYNAVTMNTGKTRHKELKEVSLSFRLPWSVIRQIDEAAHIEGSSRSLIIRRMVLEKFPAATIVHK